MQLHAASTKMLNATGSAQHHQLQCCHQQLAKRCGMIELLKVAHKILQATIAKLPGFQFLLDWCGTLSTIVQICVAKSVTMGVCRRSNYPWDTVAFQCFSLTGQQPPLSKVCSKNWQKYSTCLQLAKELG